MSNSFVTTWTIAHQASLTMRFPRQEYWSGYSFPSPGDPPNPGTEPGSPALQTGSSPFESINNAYSIDKKQGTFPHLSLKGWKSMVFPVVMYGCESWMVKKAER